MTKLVPLSLLKGAPDATIEPSELKHKEVPDMSPAASPSISAPN